MQRRIHLRNQLQRQIGEWRAQQGATADNDSVRSLEDQVRAQCICSQGRMCA